MDLIFDARISTPGNKLAVIWGHGGASCIRAYDAWEGCPQSNLFCTNVFYNAAQSFPNEAECWTFISKYYLGTDNPKALCNFHRLCPSTMTNFDMHHMPPQLQNQPDQSFQKKSATNIHAKTQLYKPTWPKGPHSTTHTITSIILNVVPLLPAEI